MLKFALDYSVYGTANENIVFLVHGFKGFKDWGFFPYVAQNIAERTNFQVITFNFSHNGVIFGDTEITDLQKFENNTYSLEIQDLITMISLAKEGCFGKKATSIYLLGHSRGGGIVLLTTALLQNPVIKKVVTYATINHVDRFDNPLWQKQGYIEVVNSRNGQVLRLGKALYEDIQQFKDTKLNILQAVGNIDTPVLLIHGTQDESVPYQESEAIYKLRKENQKKADLLLIENTGHTFGIKHPFTKTSPELEKLIEHTISFLLS